MKVRLSDNDEDKPCNIKKDHDCGTYAKVTTVMIRSCTFHDLGKPEMISASGSIEEGTKRETCITNGRILNRITRLP